MISTKAYLWIHAYISFGLSCLSNQETSLPECFIVCRYAQYGDVSSKVDVYAFGVVLYELISAKEAVVKTNEEVTESIGLVALVFINYQLSCPTLVTTSMFSMIVFQWIHFDIRSLKMFLISLIKEKIYKNLLTPG